MSNPVYCPFCGDYAINAYHDEEGEYTTNTNDPEKIKLIRYACNNYRCSKSFYVAED